MTFCRRHLSAYQRRSMSAIEIMLGVCIAFGILGQAILLRHDLSLSLRFGLGLLAIAPVFATIFLMARYLRGEKDEYLRGLVMESMLWGLGAVLVCDSFFAFFHPDSIPLPIGNMSMDVFVLIASITLEVRLWRNQ